MTVCNPGRCWNGDVWNHLTTFNGAKDKQVDASNVSCASITGSPVFRLFTLVSFVISIGYSWHYGTFCMCGIIQCPMDFMYALTTYVLSFVHFVLAAIDNLCCGILVRFTLK